MITISPAASVGLTHPQARSPLLPCIRGLYVPWLPTSLGNGNGVAVLPEGTEQFPWANEFGLVRAWQHEDAPVLGAHVVKIWEDDGVIAFNRARSVGHGPEVGGGGSRSLTLTELLVPDAVEEPTIGMLRST